MSDPKNPNIEERSTPQYALYQRENFWKSNDGEVPPFNTGRLENLDIDEMENIVEVTLCYRSEQTGRIGSQEID